MAGECTVKRVQEILGLFPDKISSLRLKKEQIDILMETNEWTDFCAEQGRAGQDVDFALDRESGFYKIICSPINAT